MIDNGNFDEGFVDIVVDTENDVESDVSDDTVDVMVAIALELIGVNVNDARYSSRNE